MQMMRIEQKQKKSIIEIERFIACTAIFFFHHNCIFTSGWIFVEFFYILTGYFSVEHFKEKMSKSLVKANDRIYVNSICLYTLRKYLQLVPFITISLGIHTMLCFIDGRIRGLKQVVIYGIILMENILNLTGYGVLQKKIGISEEFSYNWMLDGIFWYTAALFVALPVFLWMVYKLEKYLGIWMYMVCPAFIYGILMIRYGSFSGWSTDDTLIYLTLNLRALAGMLYGGGAYMLSQYVGEMVRLLSSKAKVVLCFLEFGSFAAAILLSTTRGVPLDYLIVLLFSLSLTITMVRRKSTLSLVELLMNELGSIAMPVFCLQDSIYEIFIRCIPFEGSILYVLKAYIVLIVFSWVLVKLISKSWNNQIEKIIGYLQKILVGADSLSQ